jgi:hypothetical protein
VYTLYSCAAHVVTPARVLMPLLSALLLPAGQRALSLASQPGSWAVVPSFGQQKGSGTAGAKGSASAAAAGKLGCCFKSNLSASCLVWTCQAGAPDF